MAINSLWTDSVCAEDAGAAIVQLGKAAQDSCVSVEDIKKMQWQEFEGWIREQAQKDTCRCRSVSAKWNRHTERFYCLNCLKEISVEEIKEKGIVTLGEKILYSAATAASAVLHFIVFW